MPRQSGHIDLSFSATVDLSSEPLMVPPDRLLRSRDVVHDVQGAARMRPARDENSTLDTPTETHDSGDHVLQAALMRGDELTIVRKRGAFSWDGSRFVRPGEQSPASAVQVYGVDAYGFTVSGPGVVLPCESCVVSGHLWTAYVTMSDQETPLALRVRGVDIQTGKPVGDALVTTTLDLPFSSRASANSLAIVGNTATEGAHVFWQDGGSVKMAAVVPSSGGQVGVGTVYALSAGIDANCIFGVCASESQGVFYVAYESSGTLQVWKVGSTGTASATYDTGLSIGTYCAPGLDFDGTASLLHVAFRENDNIYLHTLDETLTAQTTSADLIISPGMTTFTGCIACVCNGNVFVAGWYNGGSGGQIWTIAKLFDSTHTELADAGTVYGCLPLAVAGEVSGMPVMAAISVIDDAAGVAGQLLSISIDGTSMYLVPCGRFGNDSLEHIDAQYTYASVARTNHPEGRDRVAISYVAQGIGWDTDVRVLIVSNDNVQTKHAESDGVTYLAGSHLTVYDGMSHRESDWSHYRPEIESVVTGGSGEDLGAVETGDWSFRVLFVWVDSSGRAHRSTPSQATTVTLSSGDKVVVDVYMPRTTSFLTNVHGEPPSDGFAEFYTEIYGKAPSDANHTLMSDSTGVTAFQPSSYTAWQAVFDGLYHDSSAAVIYDEPQGTGDLTAEPSPPVLDLEIIGDRLWLLDAERPTQLWPSKILSPGYAYEFNAALVQTVAGMPGVALSQINGQPLLLRRDGVLIIYGDGPNNAGVGGEWSPPRFVSGAPGCKSRTSVVRVEQGVIYQSERGFYLLARDLSAQPISGPALDRHVQGLTFKSATYSEKDHRVVFWVNGSGGDECLCYDTQSGMWSTWDTGRNTLCAVQSPTGGVFTLDQDGTAIDLSTYATGTYNREISCAPSWRTAWLQPAGMHGRVEWEALVLTLRYVSTHALTVSVYGDGDDSSAIASTTLSDPSTERRGDVYTVWVESILQGPSVRNSRAVMFEITVDRSGAGEGIGEAAHLIAGRVLYSTDGRTHRHQVTSAGRM